MNDCCERSAICVTVDEEMGAGRCFTTCDANQALTGCGPREICIPDDDTIAPPMPSPGFCFPGDDCEPANAAEACGMEASCTANPPATFCLDAGDVAAGGDCGAMAFCQPNLVCQYGICHNVCGEGDMCAEGETCIDYSARVDGLDFKFCHDGCGVFDQADCAEAEACIPVDDAAGAAIGVCSPATDDMGMPALPGEKTQGDACTRAAGGPYWGDCTAPHLCTPLGAGEPAQCLAFCDREDRSLCTGPSSCVYGLLNGVEDVSLCIGECNVFGEDTGCGDGEYCAFGNIGTNIAGVDSAVGFCNAGAQEANTGEACVSDMETGAHNCVNGHICASVTMGGAPVCVKLCEEDPMSENDCPAGFGCRVGVFGGDAQGVGASERIGVCLEEAGG